MPGPFIDLHSHILPGYDDGAADMDTALRMLRMAWEDGVNTIVATPHFIPDSNVFPTSRAIAVHKTLQERVHAEGIEVALLLGQELLLETSVLKLLNNGQCLPLAGTRHVLVEFPTATAHWPSATELVFELSADGWIPVLAHLERYPSLVREPALLDKLLDAGCLVQLNAGSLTGLFGREMRRTAEALLLAGQVHVVASDAHTDGRRTPVLSAAYNETVRLAGERTARLLFHDNPHRLLSQEPLIKPAPVPTPPNLFQRGLCRLVPSFAIPKTDRRNK